VRGGDWPSLVAAVPTSTPSDRVAIHPYGNAGPLSQLQAGEHTSSSHDTPRFLAHTCLGLK
jgi:hypothetical protein